MVFGISFGSATISEIILFLLIAVVLFVIFKIGKAILKLIFGIIANSILGLVSMFVLNSVFGMGIPVELATIVSAALFGLPAVGTFVILRLFGIPV
jgi:inhibitor of the pro-sigma K processing machinery